VDWKGGSLSARKGTILRDQWFAVRVKSRSEKLAATALGLKGVPVFAAVAPQRRVWADRIRVVEMPLFPGYVFARFDLGAKRVVEDAPGVASIVSFGGECCPVESSEIESIQKLIASGMDVHTAPFLRVGVPVRVKHGPLSGAEGTLAQVRAGYRLVVSVSLLQRSVAVEIDQSYVEILSGPVTRIERVA
jgi:transcription antitermination factor NusG